MQKVADVEINMVEHIEQTGQGKTSKKKRKKEMQSTLLDLPTECESFPPPPNDGAPRKKKKKRNNINAPTDTGSFAMESMLVDGIPKKKKKRMRIDLDTHPEQILDHLGAEEPLWSTVAKEIAKMYAIKNEQADKELLPRPRKQIPKCATRLRNWTLAMKRNSREEDIHKALEPCTIKRARTHEV